MLYNSYKRCHGVSFMYNVIIVEDDPMVRKLHSDYISKFKQLKITGMFSNGSEALDFLHNGEKVDLIILDVFMPVMDGEEFITTLRAEGFDCAVVPVTAANEAEKLKKLSNYGIVDYLVKPFDEQRLEQAVDRFTHYMNLVSKNQPLSQSDINKLFINTPSTTATAEKGLQQNTLELVMKLFTDNPNLPFTTELISQKTGLSRVTARQYANHLAKCHIIQLEADYSTGGRPSNIYTLK